jgi:hypothetical protein
LPRDFRLAVFHRPAQILAIRRKKLWSAIHSSKNSA